MPLQEPAHSSGIKWNEVTWYSKLGAIVLFIGVVPSLTFYIGMQYQLAIEAQAMSSLNHGGVGAVTGVIPAAVTSTSSLSHPISDSAHINATQEQTQAKLPSAGPMMPASDNSIGSVTSPEDGDEYCSTDIIPIRWKLTDAAVSYKISIANPDRAAYITATKPAIRDENIPLISYSYDWNQRIIDLVNNASYPWMAGVLYTISISGTMKDGHTFSISSPGTFSILNCNAKSPEQLVN